MPDNEEIVNGEETVKNEETVSGEEIINKENTEAAGEPVSPETASSVILSPQGEGSHTETDRAEEEGDSSGSALGMTDTSPSPAPADASSAVDYVKMTLSAGVAPLEMRFAQINSCYRRLPIAYRSFTYINSVIEGVIPPEKYAYAAEDPERGERLARWNVAKAIEAVQTFEAFDRNVEFVTARVPASLTRVPDMYAWMKSLLELHGLTERPERLCLEFPRTLLYEDVETARPALLALKLLKVRTLVAGIGERDCPDTALVELPVDMVLLAPRISAFSDNRDKGQVFTAFVNFLRSLPVDVIGDGLYNDDQITIHSRADCTGYIPSSGYEGAVQHGSLRMKLEEAVEQKEEDL